MKTKEKTKATSSPCTVCHGTGWVTCSICHGRGRNEGGLTCSTCNGKGNVPCHACNGNGHKKNAVRGCFISH